MTTNDRPDGPVAHSEMHLDYAYVRDIRSPALRSTFIRLVRAGEQTPANTYEAECSVDIDGDGQVIGVTIHQYAEDNGRPW